MEFEILSRKGVTLDEELEIHLERTQGVTKDIIVIDFEKNKLYYFAKTKLETEVMANIKQDNPRLKTIRQAITPESTEFKVKRLADKICNRLLKRNKPHSWEIFQTKEQ
ncbi:MAG: hypothetical protein V6Z82_04590 [Flavobacteriales bacterium]